MHSPRVAASLSGVCEGEHFVEFYRSDERLIDNLTSFIGAGIKHGEACLVVATWDHLTALDAALEAKGVDVAGAKATRQYQTLDAARTLAIFAPNGLPDQEDFKDLAEPMLEEAMRDGRKVRLFGEMVALLWADGNEAGAVMLEQFWNDVTRIHPVTLFCAYPAHYFENNLQADMMREVSHLHSTAIGPAVNYS